MEETKQNRPPGSIPPSTPVHHFTLERVRIPPPRAGAPRLPDPPGRALVLSCRNGERGLGGGQFSPDAEPPFRGAETCRGATLGSARHCWSAIHGIGQRVWVAIHAWRRAVWWGREWVEEGQLGWMGSDDLFRGFIFFYVLVLLSRSLLFSSCPSPFPISSSSIDRGAVLLCRRRCS